MIQKCVNFYNEILYIFNSTERDSIYPACITFVRRQAKDRNINVNHIRHINMKGQLKNTCVESVTHENSRNKSLTF